MPSRSRRASPSRRRRREDRLEETWRRYYASIFNPARLKATRADAERGAPVLRIPAQMRSSLIPDDTISNPCRWGLHVRIAWNVQSRTTVNCSTCIAPRFGTRASAAALPGLPTRASRTAHARTAVRRRPLPDYAQTHAASAAAAPATRNDLAGQAVRRSCRSDARPRAAAKKPRIDRSKPSTSPTAGETFQGLRTRRGKGSPAPVACSTPESQGVPAMV